MKNICILYHGQLRTFKDVVNKQKNNLFIIDPNLNFHVLYTTWNTENVEPFIEEYPNSYIRLAPPPNRSDMKWDSRFIPHFSNPQYKNDCFPYFNQLTIWKESVKTIIDYENENNIRFDVIIRLRPDTDIIQNINDKFIFYNVIENTICVPNQYRFDVYGTGSVPDQIAWGDRSTIIKILNSLDVVHLVQQEQFVFHPETSLYNIIRYYNLNLTYCNMTTDVLLKK